MPDSPVRLVVMLIVLAPFVGSFLGVVVRRVPAGRPWVRARSACEACGHRLGPRDLVPLASFALTRGRCRFCAAPISWAHPAIELACLAVALSAGAVDGTAPARMAFGCVLGWMLLAAAWIDWTHLRLPDALTLPLVPLGLVATLLLDPDAGSDHAAAAALGYGAFRLIAWGYRAWRGRDGLGQGDAKLMAVAGAWVGLAGLPTVMLCGGLLGLALAGALKVFGQKVAADTPIPFGPCLAGAIWLVWLGVIGS